MAVELADRLIVVMEQGGFTGAALNVIDKMINGMTKTAGNFLIADRLPKKK